MDFTLTKKSSIPRDKIFAISINVENFSQVMPNYFKSITITEPIKKSITILTDEKISLLRIFSLNVKAKHVIIHPNIHEVYILSGLLRGSSFIEKYDDLKNSTAIAIDVKMKFNGVSKIFLPFGLLIKRKMDSIMDEFLKSAEMNYVDNNDDQ